ncbi:MAG: hypothetical protein EOO27_22305 [Comamonadaceae bacterium]|nr:MAG: hypothetical protein EOO27_22305 [Comamonadaceae bacterium]
MIRVRTLAALKAFGVAAWPPSVIAAQITFGQAVEKITSLEWMLVLVLTTLSGGTALLIRISAQINEAPPDAVVPPVRNLALLIAAHMGGSWLAGLMAFFSAAHFGMPGLLVGFFVPAVSFGGAKACELIYNRTIGSTFGRDTR